MNFDWLLHKLLCWKDACDLIAVATTWSAALSIIQGIFGAVGAVMSVIYLFYRIRSAKKQQ